VVVDVKSGAASPTLSFGMVSQLKKVKWGGMNAAYLGVKISAAVLNRDYPLGVPAGLFGR
jgi:hypothetical protein